MRFVSLILALMLMAPAWCANSGNDLFATARLQAMSAALGLDNALKSHANGDNFVIAKHRGHKIVSTKHNGVIEHLGYQIFADWQRTGTTAVVCDFIERFALEETLIGCGKLPDTTRDLIDEAWFSHGNLDNLLTINPDATIAFEVNNHAGKTYEAIWRGPSGVICSLAFPVDYQMLSGGNMVENESRMQRNLLSHRVIGNSTPNPTPEMLEPIDSTGLLALRGIDVPGTKLRNCLYYTQDDKGALALAYGPKWPVESLANLLSTSSLDNRVKARVRMHTYGDSDPTFEMPMAQLIDCLLAEGCVPYFGVMDYDSDHSSITAVVKMRNPELAYVHLLKIEAPVATLFNGNATATVTLTCYITGSSLWDENP